MDSRLDQDLTNQPAVESDGTDLKNLLGYVIYEYKGIEMGRAALRLVTASSGSTGSLAILPGSALNTPTTPGDSSSQTGETAANDSLETAPSSGDEGKVIAVNIWHLLGYIFVGVLILLIAVVLLRYYSPKQRRIRKAKQMRRIYTTDERRKQKKRRELR